jgi:hypothetical protein
LFVVVVVVVVVIIVVIVVAVVVAVIVRSRLFSHSGAESYAALLAKEMLSDLKVDQEGALSLQAHNALVLTMVKDLFVAYKRNASKK